MAYLQMRSVLSRPLEILPSLFHSAVSPQLPSTWFKHQEGWGGKETLLSDFGIQCLWLAARVKALIPWRFRKPTGNRTKFPNSYQDRHSLAGFPGTSSSFSEAMTSRCPCSLNADVSKVISLLWNYHTSTVRTQKQGEQTSDGVKPIPYLANCSIGL